MNAQATMSSGKDLGGAPSAPRPSLPRLDISALAAALARTYKDRQQLPRRGQPHAV